MYRIKNWNKFQHYKDRKPPWIKLHLALLHEVDYLALTDKGKITLIHCWMAAGELWKPDKETEPLLPSDGKLLKTLLKLEGNLRINEVKLSGYLIHVPNDYNNLIDKDASTMLSECYTETEVETETYKEEDLKTKEKEKEQKEKESEETLSALLKEIHEKLPRTYFNPYEFINTTNTYPIECHVDLLERLLFNDSFMNQEIDNARAYAQQVLNIEAGNVQARLSEQEAEEYKE